MTGRFTMLALSAWVFWYVGQTVTSIFHQYVAVIDSVLR